MTHREAESRIAATAAPLRAVRRESPCVEFEPFVTLRCQNISRQGAVDLKKLMRISPESHKRTAKIIFYELHCDPYNALAPMHITLRLAPRPKARLGALPAACVERPENDVARAQSCVW